MNNRIELRLARWPEDAPMLREVRELVFVNEQHVPVELEWDGIDIDCVHALALNENGEPIGTGRLLPDGHIGRMAVLKHWRGRGVGSQIMKLLMDEGSRRNHSGLILNAQVSAVPFYEQFGFISRGSVFEEAGIPHMEMVLDLSKGE